MKARTIVAGGLLALSTTVQAGVGIHAASNASGNLFYGGSMGASFGDVDYIDIAPMVGMHLSPQFSVGVSLLYRHVSDSRGEKTRKTNDYGTTLFARYHVTPTIFLEGDYEYLDHEFYRADGSKDRKQFNSALAGGGITSPLGRNVSSYFSVLYNFNWDQDDSPYADPWTIRFGVGVGF